MLEKARVSSFKAALKGFVNVTFQKWLFKSGYKWHE